MPAENGYARSRWMNSSSNFPGSDAVRRGKSLEGGHLQIKDALGGYVGVGANRFLAKLAAAQHKAGALDVIDGNNLRDVVPEAHCSDAAFRRNIPVRYR